MIDPLYETDEDVQDGRSTLATGPITQRASGRHPTLVAADRSSSFGNMTTEVARLAAESIGAVLGGLVGMSVAGPPGALAGAAAAPWASKWVARSLEEFRTRGETLGDAAAAAAHMEQDEVVKKALEDPGLDPLVRAILDAAARTDQILHCESWGRFWRPRHEWRSQD